MKFMEYETANPGQDENLATEIEQKRQALLATAPPASPTYAAGRTVTRRAQTAVAQTERTSHHLPALITCTITTVAAAIITSRTTLTYQILTRFILQCNGLAQSHAVKTRCWSGMITGSLRLPAEGSDVS
jgi:hypothetical protein